MQLHGDLVVAGGPIFTSNPGQPEAQAIGVRQGVIRYVGDDRAAALDAAGPGAEIIDLEGRLATPGLIDAHCHPIIYGGSLANIDLQSGIESIEDILERVRERAAEAPDGEWIQGWGYYVDTLRERRVPTKQELDRVAPRNPVLLRHRSGHEAVTNSLGLQRAGIDASSPDPVGGRIERDESGELTGLLIEQAKDRLVDAAAPDMTPERIEADLRRAIDSFIENGITSVGEANVTSAERFQIYQKVCRDPELPRPRFSLMMSHWTMLEAASDFGLMTGFGDRWLRVGPMKFFIDGTEGQRTARVSEPFADDPENIGMWMFDPEEFRERVITAHVAGWQCATHAIGDAAIELTLDAYKAAQETLPRPDIRHRVEHCSILRQDLIERLPREDVIPVPGARFASNDYPVLRSALGQERIRWYQPWNALVERGVPVCVSSDAPVQSPDPIRNLWAIVNSRSEFDRRQVMQPDERLPLDETLIAYTRNGAYATHEESIKGMIREGMLADLTIFNQDLFQLDQERLDEAHVDLTVVAGRVVYRRT